MRQGCPSARKRRREKDNGWKKESAREIKNVKIKHQWGTQSRELNSKKESEGGGASLIKALSTPFFPCMFPPAPVLPPSVSHISKIGAAVGWKTQ